MAVPFSWWFGISQVDCFRHWLVIEFEEIIAIMVFVLAVHPPDVTAQIPFTALRPF